MKLLKLLPLLALLVLPVQASIEKTFWSDQTLKKVINRNDSDGTIRMLMTYDTNNEIESYQEVINGKVLTLNWSEGNFVKASYDGVTFTFIKRLPTKLRPNSYKDVDSDIDLTFTYNSDYSEYVCKGTWDGDVISSGSITFNKDKFVHPDIAKEFKEFIDIAQKAKAKAKEFRDTYE